MPRSPRSLRSPLPRLPWLTALAPLGALAILGAAPGCASEELRSVTHEPPVEPPTRPPGAPVDWSEQVSSVILTDRFNDGDPSNNDQGAGEYDPGDGSRYSGGDLQGIVDRLDYIRDLGATTLWITPPVANQWLVSPNGYSGYHGYWAENFEEVDRHQGDLDTYKALGAGLHDRGMLLVQDIVVNHTGNFFHCEPDPTGGEDHQCTRNEQSLPVTSPTQPPFDQNDPASAADRAASIYHFTPRISDYSSEHQRYNYALANLDDLDTENPVVVDALKDSYNHWIREVGVDGFRIDTIIYTPRELYADFIHSRDLGHRGVKTFAAEVMGKPDFFSFGEAWIGAHPYDDSADRRIAEYLEKDGQPLLDSALNFPLQADLQGVFARGRPTRELAYRLETAFRVYPDPNRLLNFIDNHDQERFLASGSDDALKQALGFIFTIPGIPVLYYGTEQGFTLRRGSMFAGGHGSGGVDHFEQGSELYRHVQDLTALRKAHPALRKGALRILADNGAAPGVLAYALAHEEETALVLFNTADHRVLVDGIETGLDAGAELGRLWGLRADLDLATGAEGRLLAELEPRSMAVFSPTGASVPAPAPGAAVTLDFPADTSFSESPLVTGTLTGAAELLLVIDGNLDTAQPVSAAAGGAWSATLGIENLPPDPSLVHTLAVYVPSAKAVLARREFTVDLAFVPRAEVDDPIGDDAGPLGVYGYPTDGSYAQPTMDIERVVVSTAGNNLRVSLTMGALSSVWNPVYGFDHVSFTVYLDVPGQAGATALPFQNASAPSGMQWDVMAIVGGWVNAVHRAEGASPMSHGAPGGPAPVVSVDWATETIHLVFTPQSLGMPPSLDGLRIYVTTWDYDGGYRPLVPLPEPWKFSGGDGAVDPLVLDDTGVIELLGESP